MSPSPTYPRPYGGASRFSRHEVWDKALQGFGYEDIIVKLGIKNTPENRAEVRRIVLRCRAEYRGWVR
jgi:hypothetical protein